MEITSPPATRTVELRDLDITFVGGVTGSWTLHEEDTLEESDNTILLVVGSERTIIRLANILWSTMKSRTMVVEVEKEVK